MGNSIENGNSIIEKLSFDKFRNEVLDDYRLACISRETSLLGRKEVLTGKAKFGIFGDGKEIAQVAMAKFLNLEIFVVVTTVTKLLCLPVALLQWSSFLLNCMPIRM